MLKHDETVQKQSFEQSYKNFWSFVDFNAQVFVSGSNLNNNKTQMNSNSN